MVAVCLVGMPGTTRLRRLLDEAVHRGYLDAEQARICLEAAGDPIEAAIERGFVTREILQGLTLQHSPQEEASEADRAPIEDGR